MWRDGILSQPGNTTRGNTSQVYTLTQNPGLFASNFIPLWAGLTEGNATQGAQVVAALQNSSLIGPSGEWVGASALFASQSAKRADTAAYLGLRHHTDSAGTVYSKIVCGFNRSQGRSLAVSCCQIECFCLRSSRLAWCSWSFMPG